MRKIYQQELLTRKTVVQAIYQNLCIFDKDITKNFHHEIKVDNVLFEKIINKVVEDWELFPKQMQPLIKKEDLESLSRCAQAVLRATFSELTLKEIAVKIIINDYLDVAHMFCEKEKRFLNKIMDAFNAKLSID